MLYIEEHIGVKAFMTTTVVNEKLNITKEYKKKSRQDIYYIEKFGLESHTKKQGIADSVGYLTSLKGRIAFVLQTCPTDSEFLRYKNFLQGDRRIST